MSELSYFDILGVSQTASHQEIVDAYINTIKNAKKNNLDIYEINKAYDILKNPLTRYNYICTLNNLKLNESDMSNIDKYFNDELNNIKSDPESYNPYLDNQLCSTQQYTELSTIYDTQKNEIIDNKLDNINKQIEQARESHDIDKYIKLRDEQRKIITNY